MWSPQPTDRSLSLPALTRRPLAGGALLLADAATRIDLRWFEAGCSAGDRPPSRPVDGGRGAAGFVDTPLGRALVRHYRRGGLVARFNADRYLWCGEARVRSFAELRVLALLHGLGLPVPAPIVAAYRRTGPWYRADIAVAEIAGAETLARRLARAPEAIDWPALGREIARFHAVGVEHVDLNAHNLLLCATVIHLVDFDRARVHAPAAPGTGWPRRVLARLDRSLRKLGAAARLRDYAGCFARLTAAHDAALEAAARSR